MRIKNVLIPASFVLLSTIFATPAISQSPYPYASIVWYQPRSPITNNVLAPATFTLRAALYQGVRSWSHGFSDSTDYGSGRGGREYMFWADLGSSFNERVPWQVVYVVDGFTMQDPLTGEVWVVYSDFVTLHHGPGVGGVSGRITWRYFH